MTSSRRVGVAAFVVLATSCASIGVRVTPTTPSFDPDGGWKLVIADDFDGSELDRSRWNLCHWWADPSGCQISSSNEEQWYVPEQVVVSAGALHLTADDRTVGEHPYVSGMVSSGPAAYETSANESFTYGAVEARMRMPSGSGLWPAFWLLPETTESRPEIDILELYGQEPSVLRVNYHWIDVEGERGDAGDRVATGDLTTDWHAVGLLWEPGRLVWYLDGIEQWRFEGDSVSAEPMYAIFNLAVGGDRAGAPDESVQFPAELEVDWYRVWQHD